MTQAEISIIIPVYNVDEYLENSFNSILNQTFGFEKLEVIFVDDCSTDNSWNIIKSFEKEYENVKSYQLDENSGYAGKPRNIGIENATAPYLMFLDPDDEYLDNTCEFLYNEITENDLNFVSANFLQYKNDKWELFNWEYYFEGINPGDRVFLNSPREDMNIFKVSASVWAKIFKRNFILDNNIRFPEGIAAQDLVFVVESLTKTDKVLYINEPIARYKMREEGSISTNLSKESLASYIKAYELFYDMMYDYDKDYLWLASRSISSFWYLNFVNSDLSDMDKVDLLKYAEPLLNVLKTTNEVKMNFKKRMFFKLCYEKKYLEAVKLTKKLYYNENNYSRDELLNNKTYFIINDDFGPDDINKFNAIFKNITFLGLNDLNSDLDIEYINIDSYYDYKEQDDEIILKKQNPDLSLKFNDLNELYEYAIEEIASNDENALLINSSAKFNVNSINLNKISILNSTDLNREFYNENLSKFNAIVVENENAMEKLKEFKFKNSYLIEDLFEQKTWEDIQFEVLSKANFNQEYRSLKLRNDNKTLKNKNKKLSQENKELKKFKTSILNSTSWKITKPLRKLKNLR